MKLIHLSSGAGLILLAACAAPLVPDDSTLVGGSGGGVGDPGTGGAVGAGGMVFGTDSGGATGVGGAVAGIGGAVAGVGGAVAGVGGAVAGVGGAAAGAGGAVAGVGGATTSSGGATSGGADCSASSFTVTDNHVDNGTLCGYAWTGFNDQDKEGVTPRATITPACGEDPCFEGTSICASGTIPASADPVYPGVMIGWSMQNTSGDETPWTSSGSGLSLTFATGGATGPTKITIESGSKQYCAYTSSGVSVPWGDFTVDCWDAGGAAFSVGTEIDAIILQIDSIDTAQTFSDFCLTGAATN